MKLADYKGRILLAIALLVAGSSYLAFGAGLWQEGRLLANKADMREKEVASLHTFALTHANYDAHVAQQKKALQEAEALLPKQLDANTAVQNFSSLCTSKGVTVEAVEQKSVANKKAGQKNEAGKGLPHQDFAITVNGRYNDITQVLHSLEQGNGTVSQVVVSPSVQNGSQVRLQALVRFYSLQ